MNERPAMLIHTGTFLNFGDGMMLFSILDRLHRMMPDASYCFSANTWGVIDMPAFRDNLRRHGFPGEVSQLSITRSEPMPFITGKVKDILMSLTEGRLDRAVTIAASMGKREITPRVSYLLLATGFAFGDYWGDKVCALYLRMVRRLKSVNPDMKVILMPQAFGPFTDTRLAASMRQLLSEVDIAFARDTQSYAFLQALDGECKVHVAPDVTIDFHPRHEHRQSEKPYAIVVPNEKIIASRTVPKNDYVESLKQLCHWLKDRGMEVYIMNHTAHIGDMMLLKALGKENFPVLRMSDCSEAKAWIAGAQLVVASRYHAAMSALTSAVPAIIIGWSHKYRVLAEYYRSEAYLIDSAGKLPRLNDMAGQILAEGARQRHIQALSESAKRHQAEIEDMWGLIKDHIMMGTPSGAGSI